MTKEKQKNVAIPESIWHKLRVFCAENKLVMQKFTAQAISEKMERENEKTS